MEIREPELEQYKQINLTENAYLLLREQKILQGKSMARIVDELIKEKYQNKENINKENKNSRDVQRIMSLFIKENPSLKWGDKTQRKACEEMLAKWSLENIEKMVAQILSVQGKPFAPVATTPYMMWKKIAQFKVYFEKERGKNNSKVIKV